MEPVFIGMRGDFPNRRGSIYIVRAEAIWRELDKVGLLGEWESRLKRGDAIYIGAWAGYRGSGRLNVASVYSCAETRCVLGVDRTDEIVAKYY